MRRARLAVLLAVQLCAASASAADANQGGEGPWREHRLTFTQHGFSTFYTCQGLKQKLAVLLRAAGARDDVQVIATGCRDPSRPDVFVRAELRFHTLAPTAKSLPTSATWKRVALNPGSSRELTLGDCELVERFRDEVLPSYATRHVVDRVRCIPSHRRQYDLRFEVFTAR